MKEFFEDLFTYNQVMNGKLIGAIIINRDRVDEKTIAVMSHLLIAQQTWNERILRSGSQHGLWDVIPVDEMDQTNATVNAASIKILAQHELDEVITYKNSKGLEFKNTVKDILFHLVNHGTYHRGQINANLRASAIEPVITEYIFYKR